MKTDFTTGNFSNEHRISRRIDPMAELEVGSFMEKVN